MDKRFTNLIIILVLVAVLVIVTLASGLLSGGEITPTQKRATNNGYIIKTPTPFPGNESPGESPLNTDPTEIKESPLPISGDEIKIHFIDCGVKADAIFIESGSETMLIDAGENKNGKQVVEYVQALGYDTINVLVGTHPDKDHIGGIDTVIKRMKIRNFYMPDKAENSDEYRDVVDEAKEKGLLVRAPYAGQKFMLGDAECTFLAPLRNNYSDVNDHSIVIRIRFGEKSFLFTGDIQRDVEEELLQSGYVLSSDVLKVSYHGGDSASSLEFLKRVKPSYGIIFCKEGDGTGRPTANVLNRLNMLGIKIYRTDINGTIICTSDGRNINFEVGKE